MSRVLITGMSGAGKTTVLHELSRRGYRTIDTDYDDWVLPDGTWDEPRMAALLAADGRRPVPELADEVERLIAAADQISGRLRR